MPRTVYYRRTKVKLAIQPNIGLDAEDCQSVVEMLNLILADEAILALKTCGAAGDEARQNVPGLNSLYTAQHKQIKAICAEITERIQILGGLPRQGSEKMIESTRLVGGPSAAKNIVSLLADHEAFIRFLREDAQKCSEMYEDQGTYALLISMLRIHEKMAWILRSNTSVEE
jgi:starvation-inducible DNA-binding protein